NPPDSTDGIASLFDKNYRTRKGERPSCPADSDRFGRFFARNAVIRTRFYFTSPGIRDISLIYSQCQLYGKERNMSQPGGRMKVTVFAAVAAVMGMATFSTQAAVVVVNDSFDTYADQAAFEAIWTPIASGTPSSAELSTLQASS